MSKIEANCITFFFTSVHNDPCYDSNCCCDHESAAKLNGIYTTFITSLEATEVPVGSIFEAGLSPSSVRKSANYPVDARVTTTTTPRE